MWLCIRSFILWEILLPPAIKGGKITARNSPVIRGIGNQKIEMP
jgi:hypothetical protein